MTLPSLPIALPTPGRPNPERETVVLLHSSAASARQWDALAEQLQPVYDVQAIDLHGHGRQADWAGARPLSVHDEAELVMPVLQRARGGHVIGHSYGGAVAIYLAATQPQLVRSLAVYEPVLFRLLADHEPAGAAAQEAFGLAGHMRTMMAAGRAAEAAQRFVDYWSGASAWQRLGPQRQGGIVARMATVVQHFDALYGEPLPPALLERLTMPVLCLSGADSTPAALRIAALLRELLPQARHESLPGLAHMGPITQAPLVNERLLRFHGLAPRRAAPVSPPSGQVSGCLSHP